MRLSVCRGLETQILSVCRGLETEIEVLSVHGLLSVCPFVCPGLLSVCSSVCPFVRGLLSVYLSICSGVFIRLSVRTNIHLELTGPLGLLKFFHPPKLGALSLILLIFKYSELMVLNFSNPQIRRICNTPHPFPHIG